MSSIPKKQGVQQVVGWLLVAMLSAMVALTFTDVIGRRLFNTPVFGANDITEHLMALIIFSGLPLLTAQRGHLSIDLLDKWVLQPKWRVWHKLVDVLIAAVLALTAWEYFVAIEEARQTNEVSPALTIPRAWAYAYIACTCAIAAVLALLVQPPKAEHHVEEFAS
ncbi:MAG: hypothetical protein RL758_1575 [Pseudomonadota bacterium]|jgi:TRAP-type transport system small permease protein